MLPDCFQKPTKVRNRAFGVASFISYNEVLKVSRAPSSLKKVSRKIVLLFDNIINSSLTHSTYIITFVF